MSDNNSNSGQRQRARAQKNKKASNVIEFKCPEKIDYNVDEIELFINTVFKGLNKDENILCWEVSPGSFPKFPVSHDTLITRLQKRTLPKSHYFGTSTCRKHPDGNLYNRKDLFTGLYVVVLDDIGTKVPTAMLDGVKPTYVIESSQGNYQYGFVLAEPIYDVDDATNFVRAIYASGFTDEGGAMPTKLVRLPCGVNGKKGPKQGFLSSLKEFNPKKRWGRDELLDALKVPYTYDRICNDPELFKRSRTSGSLPWTIPGAEAPSSANIVDPILEELYARNQVVNDNGLWTEIICPWHENHTDQNAVTAGYKPLGRGENPYNRGFHCFHASCKDNNTIEFLEHVHDEFGVEAGMTDYSSELTRDWVFDRNSNGMWNIRNPEHLIFTKALAFKESFPRKFPVMKGGKMTPTAQHILWTHSPLRLVVDAAKPFIGNTDLIVEEGGHKFLNTYQAPMWGEGSYDQDDVDKFLDYVAYLIPDEKEQSYFLNWLVAKIQDPCFRGTAIVMVAELQGVGRSTLGDMISTLIGVDNKAHVNFDKLLSNDTFNEWASKPLVISDETLTTSPNSPKYNRAYEALKDFLDPRPKRMTINPKFGQKYEHFCMTSFLLFTNHRGAIAAPVEDRRLYVVNNALVPESPEFFKDVNAWLEEQDPDGKPRWARNVYRWMMTQEPDMDMLLAPPEVTAAKQEMRDEVMSGVDILVDAIESIAPSEIFRTCDWEHIIKRFIPRVTAMDTDSAILLFRRLMQNRSKPFRDKRPIFVTCGTQKISGRPRLFKTGIAKASEWNDYVLTDKLPENIRARMKEEFKDALDAAEAYAEKINEFLQCKDL